MGSWSPPLIGLQITEAQTHCLTQKTGMVILKDKDSHLNLSFSLNVDQRI